MASFDQRGQVVGTQINSGSGSANKRRLTIELDPDRLEWASQRLNAEALDVEDDLWHALRDILDKLMAASRR